MRDSKLIVFSIVFTLLFFNFTHIISQAETDKEITFGIAVTDVSLVFEDRIWRNNTSSQKINFNYTVSHWNPNNREQWVRFGDMELKVDIRIFLNKFLYENNPHLEVGLFYVTAPMYHTELFQSGVTITTPTSIHSLGIYVLNYTSDGLPFGIYSFNHYRISLCKDSDSYQCDIPESMNIEYYGGTLNSTENGIEILYDTLPDNWGEINTETNDSLSYNSPFFILPLSLFTMYVVRKQFTNI
ncbi:MAG: hypothetical protein HeimC2_24970 [Candidatus Heimdallarchaeota archaeon LC_2]|nr:MAG: hypothetical protein HeimC2_24970 [Candidatus Heimdallarchaeota archaeon LC_2]